MQQFLQQTLTDGTPLWVVITKDVVLPLFTLAGGVIVFLVWYRRKRIEHKLMHQTKAYEILLDKEMQFYEELILFIDKMEDICLAINEQFYKYKNHEENRILQELENFNTEIEKAFSFIARNEIYASVEIYESSKKLMQIAFRMYLALYGFSCSKNSDNDLKIMEEKMLHDYGGYIKGQNEVKKQIKMYLENISRIK